MNFWILRVKVHSSWLIAVIALGVVVGVIFSLYIPTGAFSSLSWVIVAVILLIVGFWRRRRYIISIVFIAGALMRLWRADLTRQKLAPYEKLIGHHMTIVGKVTDYADIGASDELILRAKRIGK